MHWWKCASTLALSWRLVAAAGTGTSNESTTNSTHCPETEAHSTAWWTEAYEHEHYEEVTVVALVGITLLVDLLEHKLDHLSQHSVDYAAAKRAGRKEHAAHEMETKGREPLWAVFLNRATAEFTVLGILAFVLWICKLCGCFNAIDAAFQNVTDIALPTSPEEYLHTTENVHMHLFMTFFLYFVIVGFSLVSAQRNMAAWAAMKKTHQHHDHDHHQHFQTSMGSISKVIEQARLTVFTKEDFSDDFNTMRETFLEALQAWSGKWAFFDETLGKSISEFTTIEDGGIVKFLSPWFPFAHYLLQNYRFLLDMVVVIQPGSLVAMIVINGFQATVHRLKMDFEFSFVWILAFALITVALWFYTARLISQLKKGTYIHGKLADVKWKCIHSSSVPKYVCLALQVCLLYICFELTAPLAHSDAWMIDYWRSVSHVTSCFVVMPLFGWLIWGNLLARLALTLSCGFMISEENILRIQVMVELHQQGKTHGKKEVSHQHVQTDESKAHKIVVMDSL